MMELERLTKNQALKICCVGCRKFLLEHKFDTNPPAVIIVNVLFCKKCKLKFEVDSNTDKITDIWKISDKKVKRVNR